MKNLFDKIKKFTKKATVHFNVMTRSSVKTLSGSRGEGYVDTGVKILIAVVIGALLLTGLYTLFSDTVLPSVTQRISELFSYSGK